MSHRTRFLIPILFLFILSVPIYSGAKLIITKEKPDLFVVEDFSEGQEGEMPSSLRTYPFQRRKAREVYSIGREGEDLFLRSVDDRDTSTQVFLHANWDIETYPFLRWRWRAQKLPAGANETARETNDSACGVYVVFGKYMGRAIKYVWSTSLTSGTIVPKEPDKMQMIIKDSGGNFLGKWRTVMIDVAKDYERLFGVSLNKNPSGIAILTDGNATHSPSACDYDDFTLLKEMK